MKEELVFTLKKIDIMGLNPDVRVEDHNNLNTTRAKHFLLNLIIG